MIKSEREEIGAPRLVAFLESLSPLVSKQSTTSGISSGVLCVRNSEREVEAQGRPGFALGYTYAGGATLDPPSPRALCAAWEE